MKSLVDFDLGNLSKPVTKLIEAVRAASGAWFEKDRIIRRAEAEGEAKVIHALADATVKQIALRARERLAFQEIRRQQNIEKITGTAIHALPAEVNDESVDPDWMSYFFEFSARPLRPSCQMRLTRAFDITPKVSRR